MSERTAEVDQTKGMTLEQISALVDRIGKEFRNKQSTLAPLVSELKAVRLEYQQLDSDYNDFKATYDKVAVKFDLEKQTLEKDCDTSQVE
jgi:intraflagellar transport protein 81